MSTSFIEGTWEEIELRKAEFVGGQLRVTIVPERAPVPTAPVTGQPKKLTGFGVFKGKIGSSEEFALEKQAELDREDSSF